MKPLNFISLALIATPLMLYVSTRIIRTASPARPIIGSSQAIPDRNGVDYTLFGP